MPLSFESPELYDPRTNPLLAQKLDENKFDYSGLHPRNFTPPGKDGPVGALLFRSDSNLVVILMPGAGTGVFDHTPTAKIKFKDKDVGYMGELHPETLRAWTIKMPVSVIEIELGEIFNTFKD